MSVSIMWEAVRKKGVGIERLQGAFDRVTMYAGDFHSLYERFSENPDAEDDVDMGWYSSVYNLDQARKPGWADCINPKEVLDSLLQLRSLLRRGAPAPSKRFVVKVKDAKTRRVLAVSDAAGYQSGTERVFVQCATGTLTVRDDAGTEIRHEDLTPGQVLRGQQWGGTRPFLAEVAVAPTWGEPLDTIEKIIGTCCTGPHSAA